MAVTVILVHSPLVGPGTLRNLVPALEARGYRTLIADIRATLQDGAPFYRRIVDSVMGQMHGATGVSEVVLAGHSGAGVLLPAIAEASANVSAAIFIDALLPQPRRSWFDTAPPALAARLRALAREGRIPPWHEWWPRGSIEALLPDPELYKTFTAELSNLPLAYFEERAPDIAMPSEVSSAYLQLSAACKGDADMAEVLGWDVRRLDLHHLAPLTHSGMIASAFAETVARMASVRRARNPPVDREA